MKLVSFEMYIRQQRLTIKHSQSYIKARAVTLANNDKLRRQKRVITHLEANNNGKARAHSECCPSDEVNDWCKQHKKNLEYVR